MRARPAANRALNASDRAAAREKQQCGRRRRSLPPPEETEHSRLTLVALLLFAEAEPVAGAAVADARDEDRQREQQCAGVWRRERHSTV